MSSEKGLYIYGSVSHSCATGRSERHTWHPCLACIGAEHASSLLESRTRRPRGAENPPSRSLPADSGSGKEKMYLNTEEYSSGIHSKIRNSTSREAHM